jgi:membrane fusion protein, copper/silver efflux system
MSTELRDQPVDGGGTQSLREGEERPPAGVKVMAVVRWALVALMAAAATASILHYAGYRITGPGERGGGQAEARVYYCPMHPQVMQDHPGECPICHMSLVPRAIAAAPTAAVAAPAGAGEAGGRTRATGAGSPLGSDGGVGKYWCPMHPDVTSDDPNAECELCGGMRLQPRPAPGSTEEAQALAEYGHAPGRAESAVPGLVPVDLGPERVQLIGMKTAQVAREPLGGAVRTVGVVTANERGLAQINPRFAGYIEKLMVSETGQRVRRGQVLATIYSPEVLRAQQELLTALSWKEAENPGRGGAEHQSFTRGLDADARRRLELLGVSAGEIEAVTKAGKPVSALPLRSPVDGYVIGKTAVAGAVVQPGVPLFEIANLSTVWVLAEIYESDMARVRVGQPAHLELPAYPGERFKGRVQFVFPTVDPASRTLRVRLEIRNPARSGSPKLRPGMYGHVALELPASTALVVPREAVVDTGELQYLFLAKPGGRFEPRRIKVGRRAGDRIEVLEGVVEAETVVTTANFLLDSESRLRAAIEAQASKAHGIGAGSANPGAPAPAPSGHAH